jgi:fucose 4-O-acetylase-like acetyltransferase
LIWIGLLYYSDIKETFENLYNKKSWKFLAINVFSILIIAAVNILGGAFYQDLLSARTHDFILPTLFTQLSFIVILFSITTIISKHSKFLAIFFARVGENSLYIYLLHICIAVIFLRDLGVYGYLLSIPIAIALGYVLNKFFLYIKNLL